MKETKKMATTDLVLTGLCTAVIAVLAQISIPMPGGVPVTLQTFAVALCGYILGWKMGLVSVAVYILLGAVGAPVFTGFKGGVGSILGVTGGFIWGFLPMAALCGLGAGKKTVWKAKQALPGIALGILGVALCHGAGVIWYAFATKNALLPSFLSVSLPFIPKDLVSVVAGYILACVIKSALYRANVPVKA